MVDENGAPVEVTERGLLSGVPARLHGRAFDTCWVRGWAGPWLYDERWWLADVPAAQAPAPAPPPPAAPVREKAGPYSWGPGDSGYRHPAPAISVPTRVSAPARYRARLQVLTDTGSALLLLFGTGGWQVEGMYD